MKLCYVFNSSEVKRRVFKNVSAMNAIVHNQHTEEAAIFKLLFDLEILRISLTDNLDSENDAVLNEFENSTKLMKSCYQVKISYKEHSEPLQDNYSDANNSVRTFVKRF